MKLSLKFSVILILLSLLSSCGSSKKDDDSSTDSATTIDSDDLQGSWGNLITAEYLSTIDIKDNQFIIKLYTCYDTNCTNPYFLEKLVRTFLIEGSKLKFTIVSNTAAVLKSEWASTYSNNNTYGYTDWIANEEKNISGRRATAADDPVGDVGEIFYRDFKLDGDKLYFGDKGKIDSATYWQRY